MDERRRSRSPGQERPRKTGGGFRWKDKRRDNDSGAGGDERRLERGYRDRGDRPRSPRRERERDAGRQADRYKDSEWGRERTERDEKEERRRRKREKREREAMTAAQSSEPMIVVNVNDDNHGKIKADLESFESLMDHNILYLRSGNEPRCRFG